MTPMVPVTCIVARADRLVPPGCSRSRWDTVDTATPNAQKLAIPVVLLGAVPPGVPPTVPWDT